MNLVEQGNGRTFENLFVGNETNLFTTGIKLQENKGILKRGTVLTKDVDGNYKIINADTEVPEGVLTDDIDTENETITTMYRQGHFNKDALIFGESITDKTQIERKLREINILLSTIQE